MHEMDDPKVMLEFSVPSPDTDGAVIGAIFDAVVDLAPPEAVDFGGSGDTLLGKAWIYFYLDDAPQAVRDATARDLIAQINTTVLADPATAAA